MPKPRDRSHFCASELNVHGLSVLASVIRNPATEVRQYILDNVRDLTGIDLLDSKAMAHLTPDQVTMLKHYEFEHVNELVEDLADIQIKDRMDANMSQVVHHHKPRQPKQREELQPRQPATPQPPQSPPIQPQVLDDDLPEDEWDEPLDDDIDLDDQEVDPEEEESHIEEDTSEQFKDADDELYAEIYDHYTPEEAVPAVTQAAVKEKSSTKVAKLKPCDPKIDKNQNGIPDDDEITYTSSSNRSANALFWFGVFITIITMAYLFMVTWLPIPQGNVRFADMASGFILGILTTVLGFFFGSSMQRTDFHSVVQKTKGGASFHALNNNLQNTRNIEQNTFGTNLGCPPQK